MILGNTPRDAKNMGRFLLWLVAAMLAYLAASTAVRHRATLPRLVPWVLLVTAAVLALAAVWRYVIYLRQADEMVRKIEIEALAVGFGAGAVLSLLAPLVATLGLAWLDQYAVAAAMMLSWAAASGLGNLRYRVTDE